MAHIYMTFDFGSDEEKAQQARHKLEGWKQAFRLDKKLLYKFERSGMVEAGVSGEELEEEKQEKPAKSAKAGKSKSKSELGKTKAKETAKDAPKEGGNVKLYLRLALSNHEKMTEERLVKLVPAEEPFSEAEPKMVKAGGAGFADVEAKFEALE